MHILYSEQVRRRLVMGLQNCSIMQLNEQYDSSEHLFGERKDNVRMGMGDCNEVLCILRYEHLPHICLGCGRMETKEGLQMARRL